MPKFEPFGMDTPQGDLDFLSELLKSVAYHFCPPRVVEIGSWVGRTALNFEAAVEVARIYCVDTWEGSEGDLTGKIAGTAGPANVLRSFLDNVGPRLFHSIFPLRGTSAFWAACWPFLVDLVFIDGDHRYEEVKKDIYAWTPHVRPGGILCGHDFGVFEGVTQAVRELLPAHRLGGECCWWAQL